MKRALLLFSLVIALFVLSVGSAFAINDPFAPGDDCSASTQAVGHPAADNLRATGQVSPPASLNNPGESSGARAGDVPATDKCKMGG